MFCLGCIFRAIDALFCSLTQLKIVLWVIWRMQFSGLTLIFAACGSKLSSSKNKLMFYYGIANAMKQILGWSHENWMSLIYLSPLSAQAWYSKDRWLDIDLYLQTGTLIILSDRFYLVQKSEATSHTKNQPMTSSQSVCLFFLCLQRWRTAGIPKPCVRTILSFFSMQPMKN